MVRKMRRSVGSGCIQSVLLTDLLLPLLLKQFIIVKVFKKHENISTVEKAARSQFRDFISNDVARNVSFVSLVSFDR